MKDYVKIFKTGKEVISPETMIKEVNECLDLFSKHFNNENIAGMDECLHFPHYILSGSDLIVWKEPGQLNDSFFSDLKKQGWASTTQYREVILVSENKIHFKIRYTRERADGSIISDHDNVWILTCVDGKWRIFMRSY